MCTQVQTALTVNTRAPSPEMKRWGRGVDHPPPSSAEVIERIELYLLYPSVQSMPVTLPSIYVPSKYITNYFQRALVYSFPLFFVPKSCFSGQNNLLPEITQTCFLVMAATFSPVSHKSKVYLRFNAASGCSNMSAEQTEFIGAPGVTGSLRYLQQSLFLDDSHFREICPPFCKAFK